MSKRAINFIGTLVLWTLTVVAAFNQDLIWVALIAVPHVIGESMNLLVIGVNGGKMPALYFHDEQPTAGHQVITEKTRLRYLADIIPVVFCVNTRYFGLNIEQHASVGDFLQYISIVVSFCYIKHIAVAVFF